MTARRSIDVSRLPTIALDSSAFFWWGTSLLIVIESATFGMVLATAIYLKLTATVWPPATVPPPDLGWGIAGLALLVASAIPMRRADRIAGRGRVEEDRRRIAGLLLVNIVLTLAFILVRLYEFRGVHAQWNQSAYASIVWTILGLHVGEAIAGVLEAGVLGFLLARGRPKVELKQLLDVRACALFWYFVVAVWIPLFVIVYVVPRFS